MDPQTDMGAGVGERDRLVGLDVMHDQLLKAMWLGLRLVTAR